MLKRDWEGQWKREEIKKGEERLGGTVCVRKIKKEMKVIKKDWEGKRGSERKGRDEERLKGTLREAERERMKTKG